MSKFIKQLSILTFLCFILIGCGETNHDFKKTILIRCDDIGMCHAVNMAAQKLIAKNIPFSASVMVCCPWFNEAVEILKDNPEVSVGVHLTDRKSVV